MSNTNERYSITRLENNCYKCEYLVDNKVVCTCQIDTYETEWWITVWKTNSQYRNKGYGKRTMRALLINLYNRLGKPRSIVYIWNGQNQYVFDWMQNNFDATCMCPLAIQKISEEDTWDSHMYTLNVQKFFNYFNIEKRRVTHNKKYQYH